MIIRRFSCDRDSQLWPGAVYAIGHFYRPLKTDAGSLQRKEYSDTVEYRGIRPKYWEKPVVKMPVSCMYWIGQGAEVAVLNSHVILISVVLLKTGFSEDGIYDTQITVWSQNRYRIQKQYTYNVMIIHLISPISISSLNDLYKMLWPTLKIK